MDKKKKKKTTTKRRERRKEKEEKEKEDPGRCSFAKPPNGARRNRVVAAASGNLTAPLSHHRIGQLRGFPERTDSEVTELLVFLHFLPQSFFFSSFCSFYSPVAQLQDLAQRGNPGLSLLDSKRSLEVRAFSFNSPKHTTHRLFVCLQFVAQFEALLDNLQALCSPDNESDLPRCIAVVLGQAPFAPKEVFLVHLRRHNIGQEVRVWDTAHAKETVRKILRKLVEALSFAPAAVGTTLTRLHVLVLAPRTAKHPFGTPKQQLDLAKPVGKKLVVQVAVEAAAGSGTTSEDPDGSEEDFIWFSMGQIFQGFSIA